MLRWLAVLSVLVMAGCADPAATESEPERDLIIDPDRPQTSYGDVETGPAVGPDLNATTAEAPRLVVGEWWRVRFSDYLGEGDIEVVRVVADVNDEGYIFGMPHEGWLKEAIAFHSPAFGDVNPDLSYDTHNVRFEAVQFPLSTGASWETAFAAQPFVATVTEANEFTATIEFQPVATAQPTDPAFTLLGLAGGGPMTLTYDARQHEIVRMESQIGIWEVVEHGYDFQGWVTVPRGEHTAIDYGTFGPVSDSHDVRPRTLTVDEGFNRMTMMHFVGTAGQAPGYVKARDVTPDGTEFLTEMQGSGYHLRFYETNAPSGTWTVEDLVVGAGFTYHMGIAYFQYDISLPDGARRADHGHAVIR